VLWSLVALIHHEHSFPAPENGCHQLSGSQTFKLLGLFGECVNPLLRLLFGFNINK
jgi:hypothetical protein